MVHVAFWAHQNKLEFICIGHANFAKNNEPDIVCASCSTLAMTLCNAVAGLEGAESDIDYGEVLCSCPNNHVSAIIFRAIETGFEGLTNKYPNHVALHNTRRIDNNDTV